MLHLKKNKPQKKAKVESEQEIKNTKYSREKKNKFKSPDNFTCPRASSSRLSGFMSLK